MTALAAVPTNLRPVPWSRLGWVAWRRYRPNLLAAAAALGLLATWLIVDGRRMHAAWSAVAACRPAGSARCQFVSSTFHDTYGDPGLLGVVLLFVPGVIGALLGAPVLAREFESGTFRYAWTQGAGRLRWTVAAIVPGILGAAAALAAIGALVTWHDRPLFAAGIRPRLHATLFPITGLAVAGWAMLGFAVAVLAGALVRRVVPAIALAVAAWFGLLLLATYVLRPHYASPRTASGSAPDDALTVTTWWTRNGVRVSDGDLTTALNSAGFPGQAGSGAVTARPGTGVAIDPIRYLRAHGFTEVTAYQPNSRYWPFQFIEFGWLTILAAGLAAICLSLVRRRSA